MKVVANTRYDDFLIELQKLGNVFSIWQGLLFRTTALPYGQAAKLLDGKGSLKHGGRWSAALTFPTVNLSTDPKTAFSENSARYTYYKWDKDAVRPRIIVAMRCRFRLTLDLVSPTGLARSRWLALKRLLVEDWRKANRLGKESESQAFGRACHDLGAEALLLPSAQVKRGVNLVFFPESLGSRSKVEILGEDDLNRWLKKR